MLFKTIKLLLDAFKYLIYPPFCIHCQKKLNFSNFLCQDCLTELVPLSSHNRCSHCYSEKEDVNDLFCHKCLTHNKIFKGCLSVFDYNGVAGSIIKKLKYEDMPQLSKGAGSFMAASFLEQNWDQPDLIVPVPISFAHKIHRGYNQSLLLAQIISEYIKIPIVDCLKREKSSYSQAGLLKYQRERLPKECFILKKNTKIKNKTILLIDDVYTTGKTLKNCAETLSEGSPKDIYALTFCKTEC